MNSGIDARRQSYQKLEKTFLAGDAVQRGGAASPPPPRGGRPPLPVKRSLREIAEERVAQQEAERQREMLMRSNASFASSTGGDLGASRREDSAVVPMPVELAECSKELSKCKNLFEGVDEMVQAKLAQLKAVRDGLKDRFEFDEDGSKHHSFAEYQAYMKLSGRTDDDPEIINDGNLESILAVLEGDANVVEKLRRQYGGLELSQDGMEMEWSSEDEITFDIMPTLTSHSRAVQTEKVVDEEALKEICALTLEVKELRSLLRRKDKKLISLEIYRETVTKKVGTLKQQIASLYAAREKEVQGHADQLANLTDQNERLSKQLSIMTKVKSEEVPQANMKIAKLTMEADAARRRVARVQERVELQERSLMAQSEAHQQLMDRCRDRYQALADAMAGSSGRIEAQLGVLKDSIGQMEATSVSGGTYAESLLTSFQDLQTELRSDVGSAAQYGFRLLDIAFVDSARLFQDVIEHRGDADKVIKTMERYMLGLNPLRECFAGSVKDLIGVLNKHMNKNAERNQQVMRMAQARTLSDASKALEAQRQLLENMSPPKHDPPRKKPTRDAGVQAFTGFNGGDDVVGDPPRLPEYEWPEQVPYQHPDIVLQMVAGYLAELLSEASTFAAHVKRRVPSRVHTLADLIRVVNKLGYTIAAADEERQQHEDELKASIRSQIEAEVFSERGVTPRDPTLLSPTSHGSSGRRPSLRGSAKIVRSANRLKKGKSGRVSAQRPSPLDALMEDTEHSEMDSPFSETPTTSTTNTSARKKKGNLSARPRSKSMVGGDAPTPSSSATGGLPTPQNELKSSQKMPVRRTSIVVSTRVGTNAKKSVLFRKGSEKDADGKTKGKRTPPEASLDAWGQRDDATTPIGDKEENAVAAEYTFEGIRVGAASTPSVVSAKSESIRQVMKDLTPHDGSFDIATHMANFQSMPTPSVSEASVHRSKKDGANSESGGTNSHSNERKDSRATTVGNAPLVDRRDSRATTMNSRKDSIGTYASRKDSLMSNIMDFKGPGSIAGFDTGSQAGSHRSLRRYTKTRDRGGEGDGTESVASGTSHPNRRFPEVTMPDDARTPGGTHTDESRSLQPMDARSTMSGAKALMSDDGRSPDTRGTLTPMPDALNEAVKPPSAGITPATATDLDVAAPRRQTPSSSHQQRRQSSSLNLMQRLGTPSSKTAMPFEDPFPAPPTAEKPPTPAAAPPGVPQAEVTAMVEAVRRQHTEEVEQHKAKVSELRKHLGERNDAGKHLELIAMDLHHSISKMLKHLLTCFDVSGVVDIRNPWEGHTPKTVRYPTQDHAMKALQTITNLISHDRNTLDAFHSSVKQAKKASAAERDNHLRTGNHAKQMAALEAKHKEQVLKLIADRKRMERKLMKLEAREMRSRSVIDIIKKHGKMGSMVAEADRLGSPRGGDATTKRDTIAFPDAEGIPVASDSGGSASSRSSSAISGISELADVDLSALFESKGVQCELIGGPLWVSPEDTLDAQMARNLKVLSLQRHLKADEAKRRRAMQGEQRRGGDIGLDIGAGIGTAAGGSRLHSPVAQDPRRYGTPPRTGTTPHPMEEDGGIERFGLIAVRRLKGATTPTTGGVGDALSRTAPPGTSIKAMMSGDGDGAMPNLRGKAHTPLPDKKPLDYLQYQRPPSEMRLPAVQSLSAARGVQAAMSTEALKPAWYKKSKKWR